MRGRFDESLRSDLEQALQAFQDEHEYRGSSPKTVAFYMENVARFREAELVDKLAQWNLASLTSYLVSKRKTCSAATVKTYHRALKTVSRWLYRRGYLVEDYFAQLPTPKQAREKPVPFTAEDIARIVEAANRRLHRLRSLALVHLLLDTGIRIGELCSLRLNSIDWQNRTIEVDGKSGVRVVPVSRKTLRAVRKYIDVGRKARDPNEVHVFLNKVGRRLSSDAAGKIIRSLCLDAGISDKKMGPHTFRHTFAVMFLQAGGNVIMLQQLLGHSQISMTEQYVNPSMHDVKNAHERFSPVRSLL